MVHTLRLDNYSPTPRKLVLGTNSSFGTESIKIERGAGWDGLNLTATWHIPGREEPLRVALLDGDAMDVPPEVTKEAKDGVLVLAGLASGVQRASCNVEYLILEQAGVYGGADAEPTPELAAQVLEAALQAKADAKAAAEDAAAAKANADKAQADAEKAQQAAENAAADAAKAGPYAEAARTAQEAAESARDEAIAAQQAAENAAAAAAASKSAADTLAAEAARAAQAAEKSDANAKQSADTLAESVENVVANTAAVAELKEKKAEIDDTAVGANAWSSKHIIDMLCPPLEESGNPVVCYPVAGYPLGVKVKWEPTQEGTGTPSPENIRPIKGRDSVTVERCGENLSTTEGLDGVYWATIYEDLLDVLNKLPVGTYVLDFTFTLEKFLDRYTSDTAGSNAFRINSRFDDGTPCIVTDGETITKAEKLPSVRKITETFVITPQHKGRVATAYVYSCGRNEATDGAPNGSLGGGKISNVTITLGSTAPTTYKPYIGQTNALTMPETVYGGEAYAESNEGQETWKMLTLDGTESWEKHSDWQVGGRNAYRLKNADIGAKIELNSPAICSHFPTAKYISATNTVDLSGSCICKGKTSFVVILDDANLETVDKWKTYLAEQYSAGSSIQVAFFKKTITPFTVTGAQPMPALAGVNTVLTDADSATVTGRADPIKRITDLEDAVASQT